MLGILLFGLVVFAVGLLIYGYIAGRRGYSWIAAGAIALSALFLLLAILGWSGSDAYGTALSLWAAAVLFYTAIIGTAAYLLWIASNKLPAENRRLKLAVRIIAAWLALQMVIALIEAIRD